MIKCKFYWEYLFLRNLQPCDFGSLRSGLFPPSCLDVWSDRVSRSFHTLSAHWSSLGATLWDPYVCHRSQLISKYSFTLF